MTLTATMDALEGKVVLVSPGECSLGNVVEATHLTARHAARARALQPRASTIEKCMKGVSVNRV